MSTPLPLTAYDDPILLVDVWAPPTLSCTLEANLDVMSASLGLLIQQH